MIPGFSARIRQGTLSCLVKKGFYVYGSVRSFIALHDPNRKTRYTITSNRVMYWTLPMVITDKMLDRMIGETSAI